MEILFPFCFQIFFDDSARNIASGKAAGLHTVIVRTIYMQLGKKKYQLKHSRMETSSISQIN